MTKIIRNKLLNLRNLPRICFYCGEPASDVEHVVPKSLVGENTAKVYSCRECNLIASDELFETIELKQDYIHNGIRRKYKKILDLPSWSQSELDELGYSLKKSVKADIVKKAWVYRRLRWKNQTHVLLVMKILENNATGKDFVLTDAEQDIIRKKGARLCYNID